jgi:integral membrane protein (TIGR01906 family)
MVILGLALPLFLVTANTWYVTNSEWLYSYNWWRNNIPARTGLPKSELNSGADQIKAYFNNDTERLDLRVVQNGVEYSLYSEREVDHMVDVKGLMKGVQSTMIWTGLVSLAIIAAWAYILRRQSWAALMKTLRWSAAGTAAVVVVLGVIMAINFSWLFTQFHFISFANDLWRLNPHTDYLLIMFPERFFMEATIFIAALVVVQFALLFAAVTYARRRFSPTRPT